MNPLSVETINNIAPYEVKLGESECSFRFFSDRGVHYSVDFVYDDLLMSDETYQLIIAKLNNKRAPRDPKIKGTILSIIEEFFCKNQSTLLYICETGDNRQATRSRLFEYWFSSHHNKSYYTLLSTSIVDDEGAINYATLIIRNDNPKAAKIIAEFYENITLLSNKP